MSTTGTQSISSVGTPTFRGYRFDEPHSTGLEGAIERARACLLGMQKPHGHGVGELQGDTILESEAILLMADLGRHSEERIRKAARYILSQERPAGGWANYPGGPADLNVSVKAYFALKIAGHDPK